MVNCLVDDTTHENYRKLSVYIRNKFGLKAKEYYDKYIPHDGCLECGNICSFKNINIGYRNYCSVLCLNRYKIKNPLFIQKLKESQINIPKKKHNEKTKALCREIMLREWSINREKRLLVLNNEETKSKISKSVSKIYYKKNITYLNEIRCESKTEEKFVNHCLMNNINVKRFEFNGEPSIKINNRWRVPDFICNNIIIDVKAFHIWFKKEIKDDLIKYKQIEKWCNDNSFTFLFWFDTIGYKTINEILEHYK